MARSSTSPHRHSLAGYAILEGDRSSKELLPPYELDPIFDDPVIRQRIGELIARAADGDLKREQ